MRGCSRFIIFPASTRVTVEGVTGEVQRYADFPSWYVDVRNVDVHLPLTFFLGR